MSRFLATVALLMGFLVPAWSATPEEVLKKAIDAQGGEELLKKYQAGTAEAKGKISIMGLELDYTADTSYMLPDKGKNVIRMEVFGQKVVAVQLFNAGKAKITANDAEAPVSDAMKEELKESANVQNIYQIVPMLDAKTYTLKTIDGEKVDGNETIGISVTAKGYKEVKLYFDAKTYLLAKLEREGLDPAEKVGKQEMIFSDYSKYEGIPRPKKTVIFQDGKKFMDMTVTKYKHLETLPAKEFDLAD